MPVMDIAENGRLKEVAGMVVLSVMSYPQAKEEKQRTAFLASLEATNLEKFLLPGGQPHPAVEAWVKERFVKLLPILHNSPARDRITLNAGRKGKNGEVAGAVLQHLLGASVHHPDIEINVEKVVWALGEKFKAEAELSPGSRRVKSRETVRKVWKELRRACHLHLALTYLFPRNATREELARLFHPHPSQGLARFLGLAEQFRLEAVERGFLKNAETWSVPEGIELESVEGEISKLVLPLPDSRLELLRAYKPQHANY